MGQATHLECSQPPCEGASCCPPFIRGSGRVGVLLEVTRFISSTARNTTSVCSAGTPLLPERARQGSQPLSYVRVNQRAEGTGSRTARVQTQHQEASSHSARTPALNGKLCRVAHCPCNAGFLPSLTLPTPGPEQVLHWGRTETQPWRSSIHLVPVGPTWTHPAPARAQVPWCWAALGSLRELLPPVPISALSSTVPRPSGQDSMTDLSKKSPSWELGQNLEGSANTYRPAPPGQAIALSTVLTEAQTHTPACPRSDQARTAET